MHARDGDGRDGASSRIAIRSVRGAFERLNPTRGRPEKEEPRLREAPPPQDLNSQVQYLLTVDDFKLSGRARRDLTALFVAADQTSEEVTSAAFDWNVEAALADAHRSLYAIYADRVWQPPKEMRPFWAQNALARIRDNLEAGFRHSLARSRQFKPTDGFARSELFASEFGSIALQGASAEPNRWEAFVRDRISLEQLHEVAAQRSLYFLRGPDPWLYAIPSLHGAAKAGLIDVLFDEYGRGRFERMHSTFYARLLDALGLEFTLQHLEPEVCWRSLATINHQWMCALTPEHRRRMLGIIYRAEARSPAEMASCLAACERLGISDPRVTGFFEYQLRTDEVHRDVALSEVLVPVCENDAGAADEIALGIFDACMLELSLTDHLIDKFTQGESSLETGREAVMAEVSR